MSTAAILTIGTEIVTGEIVNTNAAWLSERLEAAGYDVDQHLSVRDRRDDMLEALAFARKHPILVVCGGLGPTSDDLTREIVAEWLNEPLEFSEEAWQDLQSRHNSRGLQIREAHRHQCYFPKNAEVLKNPVGTAHGFFYATDELQVFVLPGPPAELEGTWVASVALRLPLLERSAWKKWTYLGVPESEVAEMVEPFVTEASLEVGYRASVPFVHVKLRGAEGIPSSVLQAMEDLFPERLVARHGQDFVKEELLPRMLSDGSILIEDEVTHGQMLMRLKKAWPQSMPLDRCLYRTRISEEAFQDGWTGRLRRGDSEHDFKIDLTHGSRRYSDSLTLPFRGRVSSPRGQLSVVEWALWAWNCWLKSAEKRA